MKFPSTFTGGTVPSISSVAATDPGPCGSRAGGIGRAAAATAGQTPAVRLSNSAKCKRLMFLELGGLGGSSGVANPSYYNAHLPRRSEGDDEFLHNGPQRCGRQ